MSPPDAFCRSAVLPRKFFKFLQDLFLIFIRVHPRPIKSFVFMLLPKKIRVYLCPIKSLAAAQPR
jgi:hypothetical protein